MTTVPFLKPMNPQKSRNREIWPLIHLMLLTSKLSKLRDCSLVGLRTPILLSWKASKTQKSRPKKLIRKIMAWRIQLIRRKLIFKITSNSPLSANPTFRIMKSSSTSPSTSNDLPSVSSPKFSKITNLSKFSPGI